MNRLMEWVVPDEAFQPTVWERIRFQLELAQLSLTGAAEAGKRMKAASDRMMLLLREMVHGGVRLN